jgi:methionine biosynthesis protein MetW
MSDKPDKTTLRRDLALIADLVGEGGRVLDVGCGDGALLHYLSHCRGVDARGIELSMDGVRRSVAQGLSVVQGDAETDLKDYPDGAFDFVILSQTLQAMRRPREVLTHLLRIGRRAIVSVPNFGYWRVRLQLLAFGRMPRTQQLNYEWWDTPNIHLCTIADFLALCDAMQVEVEKSLILNRNGDDTGLTHNRLMANVLGEQGVFLLRRSRG